MTDYNTPITTQQIVSDANDAFRAAFSLIARAAIPYMAEDAYFSDLLHDAAHAAKLDEDERLYLLVRKLGTNLFAYGDDAIAHCDPRLSDGVAVLRIKRHRFNRFSVEVIYAAV